MNKRKRNEFAEPRRAEAMAGCRRPHHASPRWQAGLTLIELLTVLAVIAIAATLSLPSLADLLNRRRLEGAATELAGDLHAVRSEAVQRHQVTRIAFFNQPAGGCYVVYIGPQDACDCGTAGAAECDPAALPLKTVRLAIDQGVTLASNVPFMLFDPRNGTNSRAGTVKLVHVDGRAIHQVVNVMGRVRSCSPGGAMPGYPRC